MQVAFGWTYIYAGVLTLPPLFIDRGFQLEPFKLACSISWIDLPVIYVYTLLVFGYMLPLVIMAGCSILCSIRKVAQPETPHPEFNLDVHMGKVKIFTLFFEGLKGTFQWLTMLYEIKCSFWIGIMSHLSLA